MLWDDENIVDLCCFTKEKGLFHIPRKGKKKKKTKREERKEQGEAGWVGGSAHRPSLERRPLRRAYESTYM